MKVEKQKKEVGSQMPGDGSQSFVLQYLQYPTSVIKHPISETKHNKKSKPSNHKLMKIQNTKTFRISYKSLLLSFICTSILSINSLFAQGPNAPEAAAFEPVDATDMVNLLTGDFTYVLPLLNIPSPEGGYPLALSYHAGISMDQEASWVGLGWSLNPGAINRNVNGFPDDWKNGMIREFSYDEGGSEYSTSVSIGVGIPGKYSVGVGLSWGSNRSFGGSISLSVGKVYGSIGTNGISAGYGFSDTVGAGVSVGFNGSVGASVNFGLGKHSNNSLSLGVGYGPGGLNGSLGISQFSTDKNGTIIKGESSGVGISLSSSGVNVSARISGSGTSLSHSFNTTVSNSDYNENRSMSQFMIMTPWAYFSFGKNQVEWELTTIGDVGAQGAIHLFDRAKRLYSLNSVNKPSSSYDVVEISTQKSFEQSQEDYYAKNNNGILANLDNYSVASQGLSGSIQPISNTNFNLKPFDVKYFFRPVREHALYVYSGAKGKDPIVNNPAHFEFNSFNGSYLKMLPYNLSYSGEEVTHNFASPPITPTNQFVYSDHGDLVYHYNSFSEVNNKMRRGRHVEYFTVADINSGVAANNGFLDVSNDFKRNLSSLGYIPSSGGGQLNQLMAERMTETFENGIGGYKITASDGKTYHYSLPVYQMELIRRMYGILDNKDENQAHTDRMQINPYATHWLLTAITGPDYIKKDANRKFPDEGDYGYWVRFDYGKWSNGYIWKTPNGEYSENVDVFEKVKQYSWGRKQIFYLDKIKTRTHTAIFSKKIRNDNKSEKMIYRNFTHNKVPAMSFMNVDSHPPLKLDKIILLKNDVANTLNKGMGMALVEQKRYSYNLAGLYDIYGRWQVDQSLILDYKVNNSANIFDINDFKDIDIDSKALKVIKFDHNYNLARNAPNSGSGKLTLTNVNFGGKKGIYTIPGVKFDYVSNFNYNVNNINDFGYFKNNPEAWSLNKITTPTGGVINIKYESDSYKRVAIKNGKVFTSMLKFSFLTTPPRGGAAETAPKEIIRIKIEVDTQDKRSAGLRLSDHFDQSKPFFMDMWYSAIYNHRGGGYDRSTVDIKKQDAIIKVLNNDQNYMIVEVLASSPFFRDVFQHSAEPISVLHGGGDYTGVKNLNLPRYDAAWESNQGERKYSMRHTLIGNKLKPNTDSGIRVKEIVVNDNEGNNYPTYYNYNIPGTDLSSGIIPYYPEPNYSINQQAPYVSLLPGPVVSYQYVTESNNKIKRQYKFKVLDELTETNNLISFGDLLQIECSEIDPTNSIKFKYLNIKNNLQSLGRIEETTVFNSKNEVINQIKNEYGNNKDYFSLGQQGQSYNSYKRIQDNRDNTNKEYYVITSKVDIYDKLENTITTKAGFTNTTYYDNHDFLTGQVIETRTISSDGTEFKTKVTPAYHIDIYTDNSTGYSMGSKVDNPTNKNMLTQTAATLTQIKDDAGDWKTINADINTWNNDWTYQNYDGSTSTPSNADQKIWRKHQTFAWKGEVDADGAYIGYTGDDDNFSWSDPNGQTNSNWIKTSEVSLYDHYSMPLESIDINGNKTSTKMGDDNSKVFAVANTGYNQMFYSGAEDLNTATNYFSGGVALGDGDLSTPYGVEHTGSKAVRISSNQKTFVVEPEKSDTYKVSVWAYNAPNINVQYQDIKLQVGSQQINYEPSEIVHASSWVLLSFYTEINANEEIGIVNTGANLAVVDDFRVHPRNAGMTSYVYNSWDELTHIISANGLATKYEYDEAGRLKKTYTEIENTSENSSSGGFKLSTEHRYNYKNQ